MNAWELVLKAFVKKYVKKKSIYTDEEFIRQYSLIYNDICKCCKEAIENFKQGKQFNAIISELKKDTTLAFTRKLNPNNSKSSKATFYAEHIVEAVAKRYH